MLKSIKEFFAELTALGTSLRTLRGTVDEVNATVRDGCGLDRPASPLPEPKYDPSLLPETRRNGSSRRRA